VFTRFSLEINRIGNKTNLKTFKVLENKKISKKNINNMLAQNFKLFTLLQKYCGLSGVLLFQWNVSSNMLEVVSRSKRSTAKIKYRFQNILTYIIITQATFAFSDQTLDGDNIKKILVIVSLIILLASLSFFEALKNTAPEVVVAVNGCIQVYSSHKNCKLIQLNYPLLGLVLVQTIYR